MMMAMVSNLAAMNDDDNNVDNNANGISLSPLETFNESPSSRDGSISAKGNSGKINVKYEPPTCTHGVYYQGGSIIDFFTRAADQGHAEAQYFLGKCYVNGEDVDEDLEQAARYYKMAADQGNAKAQNNLGACYARGEGVDQDYRKAVDFFTRAACQGLAKAQCNLGVCYAQGSGVDQDYKQAVVLFMRAAAQGLAEAQNYLGMHYGEGLGVDQDRDEAIKYLTLAVNQGHEIARPRLERYQKQKADWCLCDCWFTW